jgi:Cu/Zn superoxide dismutase
VTLGDGPNSIFHDGGTAIVIHAKEDDYKTDPGWELRARASPATLFRNSGIGEPP